ncbi:MAG: glycosyltransferase family 39 protein, partial [Firmicutes bacterium]|nr:glycosyltransferase family 39 protein [Bacillota bacterium]
MQKFFQPLKKTFIFHFLIFILLLLFVIQNYHYEEMDQAPVFSDGHITFATFYFENFFAGHHNNLAGIPFPPVVYLVTQVFFHFLGFGAETARFSITLFALILFLSVYGIGKEMGNSRYAGLAAMCLAVSSPLGLILSRTYLLDLPVAAFAALSLYIHIKTASFNNRCLSVLSGLVLALVFLVKWSAAFCLLMPVLWFFFPVLKKMTVEKKYLFIFFLPLVMVTACLYFWFSKTGITGVFGSSGWLYYYFAFVLIPCVIALIINFYPDKHSNEISPERNENINSIKNFIAYAFVFILTVIPWYMYTASVLSKKFAYDMGVQRSLVDNFSSFLAMYEDLFCVANLFMLLPIVGIVCIFLKKNIRFSTGLMLMVSMTAFLLLFLKIGISITGERYWFLMSIFLFPLAGFWVV